MQNIDLYDANLTTEQKIKIIMECKNNFWYYIREVVRIKKPGEADIRFQLNRGTLAMIFCFLNDLNQWVEFPSVCYKSQTARIWYSWLYNFHNNNSLISYIHKYSTTSQFNINATYLVLKSLPE